MLKARCYRSPSLVVLGLCLLFSVFAIALGQGSGSTATTSQLRPKINYEVQLHLLLATSEGSETEASQS